jgi:dTDP-4-dehydrorhamnose 3,5-epimerase
VPAGEDKLVRVTTGTIFDAILSLRPYLPSCRQCFSAELTAQTQRAR